MNRRTFLGALAAGATITTAGCSGEQVLRVEPNSPITVRPNDGWIEKIPATADQVKYIARDERPFDVYFFTSERAVGHYRTYLDGETPPATPAGDQVLTTHAVRVETDGREDLYEASTPNRSQQSIDASGPYYFVIDNSDYRMETPVEGTAALSVTLDLVAMTSPLPV